MRRIMLIKKTVKAIGFFIAFVIFHYGINLFAKKAKTDYLDVLLTHILYYSIALVSFYWALGGNKNEKISAIHVFRSFVLFIVAGALFYLYYYYFLPATGRVFFGETVGPIPFLLRSLETYIAYFACAFFYWQYKHTIRIEQQLRLTEKARLEAVLSHLRTQINPHFLFNTLNTVYSQCIDILPDTARGIFLLSKIMRYSLEPTGTDGKVPLDDEVAHANDYIELIQLRFPGNLEIINNFPKESQGGWQILPHLLITIIENAFKHGDRAKRFLFDLQLDKKNKQIIFRVENEIGPRLTKPGTGVGLRNVKERMRYAYGHSYTFKEEITCDKYIAIMIIPNAYDSATEETQMQGSLMSHVQLA